MSYLCKGIVIRKSGRKVSAVVMGWARMAIAFSKDGIHIVTEEGASK